MILCTQPQCQTTAGCVCSRTVAEVAKDAEIAWRRRLHDKANERAEAAEAALTEAVRVVRGMVTARDKASFAAARTFLSRHGGQNDPL